MSDEEWLREGLADAVPEPPTTPDRARSAERLARRRRRTTALGVVGTAGVVAAAAVLAVSLTTGGDDDGAIADDPTSATPGIVECPPIKVRDGVAEGSAIDQPDPNAPDAVPEGAASARLCQGPGTTFQVPDDALVTDVGDLVAAINALEPTGEPEMCTLELGPGFRIAFGYDDGSTFVVSGQLYGCRTLTVGSGYRTDPDTARQEFVDLLQAQRDASERPHELEGIDMTCAHAFTEPAGVIGTADVTGGELCIDDVTTGETTSVSVPADDLAALVDAFDQPAEDGGTTPCSTVPERYSFTLIAATAWGDRLVLTPACPGLGSQDPATRAMLERLVREAR